MLITPRDTADAAQLAKDLLAAAGDQPERVRTTTQGSRLAFDVDDDLGRAVGRTPDEQDTGPTAGFDQQRVSAANANAGQADQPEQPPAPATQTTPDQQLPENDNGQGDGQAPDPVADDTLPADTQGDTDEPAAKASRKKK